MQCLIARLKALLNSCALVCGLLLGPSDFVRGAAQHDFSGLHARTFLVWPPGGPKQPRWHNRGQPEHYGVILCSLYYLTLSHLFIFCLAWWVPFLHVSPPSTSSRRRAKSEAPVPF